MPSLETKSILAMVFVAARFVPAVAESVPKDHSKDNPHWAADRCAVCHREDPQSPQSILPETATRLCLSCHNGTNAKAESHPILRGFKAENVSPPDNWPLLNGLIACTTCHEMNSHCRPSPVRPKSNTQFLRGYREGRLLEFCTNCHGDVQFAKFNPHEQIKPDGAIQRQSCEFCHEPAVIDLDRNKRTPTPQLYVKSEMLCKNCHLEHWDFFDPGHLGQVPPPEIRERMLFQELAGKLDLNDRQLLRYARSIQRGPERLPLDEKNRIACYTCHNPHQAGVFPAGSVLAFGEMSQPTSARDGRPSLRGGQAICLNCHDK